MPERRLMAAVLADAVDILRRGQEYHVDREAADIYRDAVAWIMAERNAWPFCFVALCEALELDADKVRAQLLERNGAASDGRRHLLCRTTLHTAS
jgi:hypothetical protein